jgi:hypothetical protein
VVALHHFFEAEVRGKFGVWFKIYQCALHLQKNVILFSSPKLLLQMPPGCSGHATLAKKI